MRYHTPKAAAALLGVSVSSLRNYCATYKDFLSAEASPSPGTERKLLDQDVAILQRVVELRQQGMDTAGIVAALQVEDTTALQPYVDATATPTPPEPLQAPTVAPMHADVLVGLRTLNDERYAQLQKQIDATNGAMADRLQWFAYGLLAGLLLALVGIGVVWLGMVAR